MTTGEIIELVEKETGIKKAVFNVRPQRVEVRDARRLMITLMREEGYKVNEIIKAIGAGRYMYYYDVQETDKLLTTDKQFKLKYLACIKRIADLEDTYDLKTYASAS